MTTKRLLILFFLSYSASIPILANKFFCENFSASLAMIGICIVFAMIFFTERAYFINIVLSFYVLTNYLTRPFVWIFYDKLTPQQLAFIEGIDSFYTPEAAAVVYWSLFSLLSAWFIGLTILKECTPKREFPLPGIFTVVDRFISRCDFPFFITVMLFIILNFKPFGSGLRSGVTGEGEGLFLWGMMSMDIISIACLLSFLNRRNFNDLKPKHCLLILVVLSSIIIGILSGSRAVAYWMLVLTLIYWLMMNKHKKWHSRDLIRFTVFSLLAVLLIFPAGLFAQTLRPLYRYSDHLDMSIILDTLNYESVFDGLYAGITQLLHRLNAVKAQFFILNDWYIHEPLNYYNPIQTLMRIINDLVPGDVFPGMLTINQLFDLIYYDSYVHYSSEMWGIQGTLYLYFGHFLAPIVVLLLGLFINRLYPSFEQHIISSPAFAAFFMIFLFDVITNGTAERVIPVDIVRPITSMIIFIVIYKRLYSICIRLAWSNKRPVCNT